MSEAQPRLSSTACSLMVDSLDANCLTNSAHGSSHSFPPNGWAGLEPYLNCSEMRRTLPAKVAPHLLLFALPNQNADHSTPERIRIAEVGSFNEPLVPIQTVVMQLVGARPSVLP